MQKWTFLGGHEIRQILGEVRIHEHGEVAQ
jgi:hypothetical protein